jgi:hypothetical protein
LSAFHANDADFDDAIAPVRAGAGGFDIDKR